MSELLLAVMILVIVVGVIRAYVGIAKRLDSVEDEIKRLKTRPVSRNVDVVYNPKTGERIAVGGDGNEYV